MPVVVWRGAVRDHTVEAKVAGIKVQDSRRQGSDGYTLMLAGPRL
jgi:hypothetical protein